MALVITFPRTCSAVVMIRNSAAPDVVVSGVVPNVALLPGGGTVSLRVFLFGGKSLVIALRFCFGGGCNSMLSRFRY